MTCMKFSESQMEILGVFTNVNPSIMFKPGKKVATISNNKNILGSCVFKDIDFERKAPIYDLGNLMKTIKVLSRNATDSPDVDFSDKRVDISNGPSTMRYYYADERHITIPPDTINALGEPCVSTELTNDQLTQIFTTAQHYQLPDLCFQGKDGQLFATVTDKRNATSNSLEINLGESDKDFCFCMKIENASVLCLGVSPCRAAKGYKVELFENKVAKLTGIIPETTAKYIEDLELMIALEPDSEY